MTTSPLAGRARAPIKIRVGRNLWPRRVEARRCRVAARALIAIDLEAAAACGMRLGEAEEFEQIAKDDVEIRPTPPIVAGECGWVERRKEGFDVVRLISIGVFDGPRGR